MNERRIVVGTSAGLHAHGPGAALALEPLAGTTITAVAVDRGDVWLLADGRTLLRSRHGGGWDDVARVEGPAATCIAVSTVGLLVGTEQAHLLRLHGDGLHPVTSFEHVEGRDGWYTPWGDPADVRSIAVGAEGTIHVNVHVGGIARSTDGGERWTPALDIENDVHQVACHPARAGLVVAAAAAGLGISTDAGATWRFLTAGFHAHYCRAVAVADDVAFVSASRGPGGRRAALYRKRLDGDAPIERCAGGLPEWFADNVDTGCVAAAGSTVAFGTEDGRVYVSDDGGHAWTEVVKGLAAVRCVALL
jgi:photosystem II stability/assembly factor-like uncharacterized protein